MATLTTSDIKRPSQRDALTALDAADIVVVEDITDSKIKQITKANLQETLDINAVKGSGWTNENLVDHEGRIAQNESDISGLDSDKADKVSGATNGNFACLDVNGNLTDSGHKDSDYEDADATILKQANIVDALNSTSTTAPLSANQGKVLKDAQDVLNADDTTEGSVAKSIKDAVDPIKGTGWTDENLVDHEARIQTLENSSAKRFGLYFFDDGTFQRTGDAVGKVFRSHAGSYTAGIASDFSLEHPWAGFKNCIMDADGIVRAWQGDPTYATTDGEWMEFVPRCYTGMTAKTVGGKACLHFEVSNVRLPGLYPTGFIGADGKELAGLFIGRVPLGTSGTLVTKPAVAPTTNKTMTSFTTDIRAKSATGKWRLYDGATWTMLTILMAVETGSLDVKTTIGGGIQSSMPYGSGNEFKCTVSQTGANSIIIANAGATNMRVGMTMQVGTAYTNNNVAANRVIQSIEDYGVDNKTITLDGAAFNSTSGTTTIVSWGQPVPADQIDALYGESGYITQFDSAARSHVCYRGIWDLWGNVWQWLAGVLRVEGKFYISFNRDEHDEFSPVGKPHWLDTGWEPNIANGYQKERQIISYPSGQVSLPKTTGGTGVGANTWYAAYLYYFGVDYRTGVRAVQVGGGWSDGSYVSPFFWDGGYTPSGANFVIGARSVIEMAAA